MCFYTIIFMASYNYFQPLKPQPPHGTIEFEDKFIHDGYYKFQYTLVICKFNSGTQTVSNIYYIIIYLI